MKKYEKEVLQSQIDNEKKVLSALKKMYHETLDNINEKIKVLQAEPLIQSKVYQIEYQKVIKSQIETYLDVLQDKEFDSIEDYLKESYNNGYMGAMYSIQNQGIPLILPMNQEDIVKAIQIDSKISEGLYAKLGYNVKELKKNIKSEVSRGIASGLMYNDISRNISNLANMDMNKSMRIARTEGHRIQVQATDDACHKAKEKGADVVKQWDASLDKRTRPSHRMVDGEIRELDEKFSNGLMYPGDSSGGAAEVVNCRCALLQRARWALDEEELDTLKNRAEYFGLDKTKNFNDYKSKFLEVSKELNAPQINNPKVQKATANFNETLKNSNGVKNHIDRMNEYSENTKYIQNNDIPVPFQYSSKADVIYYNPNADYFDLYDLNYVQAHELSHRMDIKLYESYMNKEFVNSISICRQKVLDNAAEIQKWFDEGGKYENDFAVSDIISALSKNTISVPIGHPDSYWDDEENILFETFANISAMDVLDYESKNESILKEIYEAYKELVK